MHVRFLRGEDAAVLPRVEPDQLDARVLERPPYLRLLVSLRIVGQPVALVEHVERGADGGGADPEGQRALRIEARGAGERDHFALDLVERRRAGFECALGPGGDGGPHQETGPRAPARHGHHRSLLDPGDGRLAAEDRDLTAHSLEGTERVEVRHGRQGLEVDVPAEVAGENVALRPGPADGARTAHRGRAQRAPAGGGWKPKRLSTARPCGPSSRSRNPWARAGCLEAATTAPG